MTGALVGCVIGAVSTLLLLVARRRSTAAVLAAFGAGAFLKVGGIVGLWLSAASKVDYLALLVAYLAFYVLSSYRFALSSSAP